LGANIGAQWQSNFLSITGAFFMSEFITAIIVIAVVLMVISKVRKNSDEPKIEATPNKATETVTKPIVKPVQNNSPVAETELVVKSEEVAVAVAPQKIVVTPTLSQKNIQIPQDSSLRRHTLSQLHALLDSHKESRPTDSTLSRHHDSLVEVKVGSYTNDVDEVLCLVTYYENQLEILDTTEVAPVKENAAQKITAELEVAQSALPEDSTLRRHALQLQAS
jgi:hypothetical protein